MGLDSWDISSRIKIGLLTHQLLPYRLERAGLGVAERSSLEIILRGIPS